MKIYQRKVLLALFKRIFNLKQSFIPIFLSILLHHSIEDYKFISQNDYPMRIAHKTYDLSVIAVFLELFINDEVLIKGYTFVIKVIHL